MASFPATALSVGNLHPTTCNLGLRTDAVRTLNSSRGPPYLRRPLLLSTRTLTLHGFISSHPKVFCSVTPPNPRPVHERPTFLRRIVEGAAVVLFGSVLLLGRFSARPALALDDAQRPNFSSPLEEKIDATEEDEVDVYAKVLEKNPNDVDALKMVFYGKLRKGKAKDAVGFVERLIDQEPDEVEWKLLQALCYELMGKLSKAKKLFKEILKERPLLIRALHGLALAMYKCQEGEAAFEMLNEALELARRENRVTEERNIKILIAQMHVVKGDLEGASRHFQDLVNENPRDFRPYLCQGIVYSLLDKHKEAEEQFEMYRSLVPDEFPQRSFIDEAILSAKTESRQFAKREAE